MSYGEEPSRDWDAERDAAVAIKRSRRDQDPDGRGPVERALDGADEVAARIGELVEETFRRLGPILGPERPEPAMEEVRADGDVSPLADRLDGLTRRLGGSAEALARLLRRVEL
jgi:hypothetical protein